MVETIIYLAVMVAFGFACMKMAEKRGREKWLGFLMGFLFCLWAVFGYLIAGDTSKKKAEMIAEAMSKVNKKVKK